MKLIVVVFALLPIIVLPFAPLPDERPLPRPEIEKPWQWWDDWDFNKH